mgnify:CR=1 FL=1
MVEVVLTGNPDYPGVIATAASSLSTRFNATVGAIEANVERCLRSVHGFADQVFVLIGGELPAAFLRECGVELETRFGTP